MITLEHLELEQKREQAQIAQAEARGWHDIAQSLRERCARRAKVIAKMKKQ